MAKFECSSSDKRTTGNKPTQAVTRKSRRIRSSRGSFLDLAAEHRNYIYAQVLIHSGGGNHIRVTRESPTRIPELSLLRVCKQVHDEASSFFYSANSFYCSVNHRIHVVNGRKFQLREEDIRRRWFQWADRDQQQGDQDWGVLFPAPRYHRWLTRVTIDATISITVSKAERGVYFFDRKYDEGLKMDGKERRHGAADDAAQVSKSQGKMVTLINSDARNIFLRTYENMRDLWGQKPEGRSWEGRLVIGQDTAHPQKVQFMISFYEGEEEERMTRGALSRIEE